MGQLLMAQANDRPDERLVYGGQACAWTWWDNRWWWVEWRDWQVAWWQPYGFEDVETYVYTRAQWQLEPAPC